MRLVKRFSNNQLHFMVLLLAILVRLCVMFDDYSFDVNNHIAWAKDLHNRGFSNFYDTQSSEVYASLYPNYPPVAMYLFYLTYPLPKGVYNILWWLNIHIPLFPSKLVFPVQERFFLAAMMKVPAILADFGIAWLVYLFVKKLKTNDPQKRKMLILGPALVLLNPAFFYNSAYWGQIDVIPIFFVLVSIYVLFYTKRYVVSGLFFTLALLIKPTPLVFLPVYALMLTRIALAERDPKKLQNVLGVVLTVFAANLFFITAFFPFLRDGSAFFPTYKIYLHRIMEAQSLAFVTNGAFNMWAIVTHFQGIKDTEMFIWGFTYNQWAFLIAGIVIATLCSTFWKKLRHKHEKEETLFYALFLSALASFLFLTKMHERYTMLILPFLLLLSLKDKNLMKWFLVFSLFSFLNLYHSWPVPHLEALFQALDTPLIYSTLAFLQITLFFYFLRIYFYKR